MKEKLTRQEQKIFDLLLTGKIPKEIAAELNISNNTVLNHQRSIYHKLGIHSINELLVKNMQTEKPASQPVLQANDHILPEPKRKLLPLKIIIPTCAAIILAVVIPLSVMALREPKDPSVLQNTNPLVITFTDCRPDGWDGWQFQLFPDLFFYEDEWHPSPFKLGKGNKINEGDDFLVTLNFTSNIDLDNLFFILLDLTAYVNNENLHEISRHYFFGEVKADTEYRLERNLIATRSANSTVPNANLFAMYAEAETQPIITFTKFEIVKHSPN